MPKNNRPRAANVREALRAGRGLLRGHRCPDTDPDREAEALLAHALKREREYLFSHPEAPLPVGAKRRYDDLLARRRSHEPLAYLLGVAPFGGRDFLVSDRVLIPRPATEAIAAAAVSAARRQEKPAVIDVGTGSGCLALTLAAALPDAAVLATDFAPAALRLARRNAQRLGLGKRVLFRRGDLATPVMEKIPRSRPLVVVANLPYLPAAMMKTLTPDIRRFEPRLALVGGGRDGLGHYRRLLRQLTAPPRRAPLTLVAEILTAQYRPLSGEIKKTWPATTVTPIKNLAGVTVGLAASWPAAKAGRARAGS